MEEQEGLVVLTIDQERLSEQYRIVRKKFARLAGGKTGRTVLRMVYHPRCVEANLKKTHHEEVQYIAHEDISSFLAEARDIPPWCQICMLPFEEHTR